MACKKDQEIWKPVVGYEDIYKFSNKGRLKNIKSGKLKKRKNKCYTLCKEGRQEVISIFILLRMVFNENQTETFTDEYWIPVVGYEGKYSVSNKGRIKSDERIEKFCNINRRRRERIRKLRINSNGYLDVTLWNGKTSKNFTVHKLVSEAFLGPCPDGMEVCHGDKGQLNNTVENLSYGTRKENIQQRDKKYYDNPRKTRRKLCYSDVKTIREKIDGGQSNKSLALEYGVDPSTISRIKTFSYWGGV